MISSKKTRGVCFAIVTFSSTALLAGCSWFRIDAVSDTVNYRGNSGSIASLEVPPGLTTPIFDPTYTIARPVSAVDVPPPTQTAVSAGASNQVIAMPASGGVDSALSYLKDGNPTLVVAGRYDQVWAKTGIALGRMGLAVTAQQYEQGIYAVSAASTEPDESVVDRVVSFFKRFGSDRDQTTTSYRFIIGDRGEQSLIVVSDASGVPVKAEVASALLSRLKVELAQ